MAEYFILFRRKNGQLSNMSLKKKMVAGAQSRAEVKESMCVCVKGFGAQLTELSLLGCSLVRVSISGQ